jgi:hypothetical protein
LSYSGFRKTETVTVGAGASLSGASGSLSGWSLVAVVTASTWDAAKIAFQASLDGTNYFVVTYQGTEYETAAVTGAKYVAVNPEVFYGVKYIKVQSGISTSAVNQADATIVTLVSRPI